MEVMTLTEVSEFLRVSDTTIRSLAKRGKIPSRRIGTRWLFDKEDIEAWFHEGKYGPSNTN